ncbi:MAG: acyl carrier protein [Desulfobacterium sp.]|nr:acyl carrier protein [Desulfobacterium sp.]MBU3946920.1 acyl carrier protein [Pseudomonadota bacterium]MBU4037292.1 acyl carrier protein [Pseudomonadota bacterium]
MKTFERLQNIIAEQFGVNPDDVTNSANFTDDLGGDAADVMELVMEIESEFDISISTPEQIKTVGDALAVVERLTNTVQSETENKLNHVRRTIQILEMDIRQSQARGDFVRAEQLEMEQRKYQQILDGLEKNT